MTLPWRLQVSEQLCLRETHIHLHSHQAPQTSLNPVHHRRRGMHNPRHRKTPAITLPATSPSPSYRGVNTDIPSYWVVSSRADEPNTVFLGDRVLFFMLHDTGVSNEYRVASVLATVCRPK